MGWTEPTPGAFTLSPCFPTAVRATSQGGDLMSDLFNKLAMRRKGMQASVIVVHRLSCPTVCGNFPDQGLNACPLHWQVDS